ncbi:MAG: hypothetical protein HYV76_00590 [Candidatus Vogelbacteria bacterium]|nr:hypothetical protein [Candidatus Vogelbacteria bacterium]
MVSVSIFIIVAFIASTVFITVNEANKKAQAIRLIVDNLNFTLDGMTYRLAEGVDYYANDNESKIEFKYLPPGGVAREIIYELADRGNGEKSIFLTDESDPSLTRADLLSPEISIEQAKFRVITATSRSYVVISIQGKAKIGRSETKLNLQTAVTQRNF